MSGISRDEWLVALSDANGAPVDDDPSIITSGEAAALLGCAPRTAWVKLQRLVRAGKAVPCRARRPRSTGGSQIYPAYKLTTPMVAAKAKKR